MTMHEATTSPILSVHNLSISIASGARIVSDVSLSIPAGEICALVGESGSGKTTTALALLGHTRAGVHITGGTVLLGDRDILTLATRELSAVRGRLIAYVPQDPGSALNPAHRIRYQLREVLRIHRPEWDADERASAILELVRLPSDPAFQARYTHQLSGGQQQRLAIALALVCEPDVIVLDEPTTGLDVITEASIVRELKRLRDETSVAMVYISHNLAVVGAIADRVCVMKDGRIIEEGAPSVVLREPSHAYTRELVAAVPRLDDAPRISAGSRSPQPVLTVKSLRAEYGRGKRMTVACDDISLQIARGEVLGIVGESGSGKTSLGRCIAGLVAPAAGQILLHGEPLAGRASHRTREQCRAIQIVFQNPTLSLNPRQTAGEAIAFPARLLRGLERTAAASVADELLERVRLPRDIAHRYPSELSGGQRQRVAIARALAAGPQVLVCDEITSALDVSVQAATLALLDELRNDLGLAMVFITHDLAVISSLADRLVVVRSGRIAEQGPTSHVLGSPTDAYTRELVAAVPQMLAR